MKELIKTVRSAILKNRVERIFFVSRKNLKT